MTVPSASKLALRGNREAACSDARPQWLIRRFRPAEPACRDDEIIALAKNRSGRRQAVRIVARPPVDEDYRSDWRSSHQSQNAAGAGAAVPLSLQERDVRLLAKSKNISATVAAQAKRWCFSAARRVVMDAAPRIRILGLAR